MSADLGVVDRNANHSRMDGLIVPAPVASRKAWWIWGGYEPVWGPAGDWRPSAVPVARPDA